MKHTLYILFIIIILAFSGCKKDDVRVQEFKITSESVYKNTSTIIITVNYTYASVLQSVEGYISESSDMTNAVKVNGDIQKYKIVLMFDDLKANTTYYYYYILSNGIDNITTEGKVITTNDYCLPTVITNDVIDITATSAICGGKVTDDGESEITARGICYSLDENPTINDSHTIDSIGIGSFTSHLVDLNCDTTYYYRAYATNIKGTSYGEQIEFNTLDGLPNVMTRSASNITSTSVVSGGIITDDGGFEITARGICWSTNPYPTINDNYTTDGIGTGSYYSTLNNLTCLTTYYIRAYATNIKGTKYGTQISFTTLDWLPTVLTSEITNTTTTSAICGGRILSDGGFEVTSCGVCWSTIPNPTIEDEHSNDGANNGIYTSNLSNLSSYTTYFVRAYATNCNGTNYGEQKSFQTQYDAPSGAILGLFSVSESKQVCFSRGNLQYKASTNTWRFANNQYDYIGEENSNISSTYNGWIDLFGWGTSGYNHGAVCYQPWSISQTNSDYYAYGSYTYNLNDQTGKADWGYNRITNGGNQENLWRTLTVDEWMYVLITRNTSSSINYAKAQVNGVNGIILLPDDWHSFYYYLNNTNSADVDFSTNIISAAIWKVDLEQHGAIFLPAAGYRNGTMMVNDYSFGSYKTASVDNSGGAYDFYFGEGQGGLGTGNSNNRYVGRSVRLVCDAE